MPSLLTLALDYYLLSILLLAAGILWGPHLKSRWPDWWERWIAAPYPDEFEIADDYRRR